MTDIRPAAQRLEQASDRLETARRRLQSQWRDPLANSFDRDRWQPLRATGIAALRSVEEAAETLAKLHGEMQRLLDQG